MSRQNKFLALALLVCGFLFFASTARADSDDIKVDTIWHKADEHIFDGQDILVDNGATLTIEKGAHVELNNGSSLVAWNGNIIANGTQYEKITITANASESRSVLEFNAESGNDSSFFRYVEISNLGSYEDMGSSGMLKIPFINTALAYEHWEIPAMRFYAGKLHMENCRFFNNGFTDIESEMQIDEGYNPNDYLEIVNSNFENNNNNTALTSYLHCTDNIPNCESHILLKNNFYGDSAGPSTEEISAGEKINGKLTLDGWKKNSLIADPAIIIPGIMGSAKLFGAWKLDPILHIYDNLVESFEKNGYEKNQNLFEFPYEWRNSNEITAGYLKTKIDDIIAQTKISKVDVVAHSMGGLVARAYIEGNDYGSNVDQLITLGTPHRGSPKSYLSWEGGELGVKFDDYILERIFSNEASHNGKNLKDYIQSKILSVKDLLPDYNYLSKNGVLQDYSDNYPRNGFLEELNNQANLEKLGAVDFTNIIGNTKRTISEIKIVDSTVPGKWEHGMPENFYDESTDQGLIYGDGDETVPEFSAKFITAEDDLIKKNSTHRDLPTKAQCEIIKELTNKSDCDYVDTYHPALSTLFVSVYSPIDIQVIAPNGEWAGRNIKNLDKSKIIDGSYHTGYEGVDSEFLTIPDPENGEYTIITQGTDNGDYKVEISKLTEDPTDSQKITESTATISGAAVDGQPGEEKTVTVAGSDVTAEKKDTTPPAITGFVMKKPNDNGWHNTDVTVHFDATDEESGIDFVTPDQTISSEGENQKVAGSAKDKAGNENSFIVSGINIDKSAPNTGITFNGTVGKNGWYISDVNMNFTAIDNLSGVQKIYYSLDNNAYQNGNELAISNEGSHSVRYYAEDNAGNKEDIKTAGLKIDKTAPNIVITAPQENKEYSNNKIIAPDYSAQDAQSAVSSEAFFDSQKITKPVIDLSLEHLGEHSFKIAAADEAGNTSEQTTLFKIITGANAIFANVGHYFDLGYIKTLQEKRFLQNRLALIQIKQAALDLLAKNPFIPKRLKEIPARSIRKQINNKIIALSGHIQKSRNIIQPAKDLLIESLNYIKK